MKHSEVTPLHDQILMEEIARRKQNLWFKGNLSWKLHAAQRVIYDQLGALPPETRNRVVLCARGFGKTYYLAVKAIERCFKPPFNHPVIIIGPEKQQMVEILTPILSSICADAPQGLIKRLKSESKWQVGDSQLVIGGFNRDSIDRFRGMRPKEVFLDEIRDVAPENYKYGMQEVILPMALHLLAPVTITTTPPRELDHPFIIDTMPQAQLENAFFRFTIFDNPMLTQQQIDIAFKECGSSETSESWCREYLSMVIRSAERSAIPQFDEQRHVRLPIRPDHAFFQVSSDVGGVQDKTVIISGYYDYVRSRLCIEHERVFGPGTPSTTIVQGALELEEGIPWKDGPDRISDAPGQLLVDMNSLHGYTARLPLKDQFDAQINNLQVAFGNDQIEISPNCPFLIATLKNGMLNKKRNDYERSSALGHCDAIAALSYMWRNIKRNNPFPAHHVNVYAEWQRPSARPVEQMTEIANALAPRYSKRR